MDSEAVNIKLGLMECLSQRMRYSCGIIIKMITILMVTIPQCASQEISSDLTDGQLLCPGSRIVLTCITRNSAAIVWRNSDYITRLNSELQFGDLDTQGAVQRSVINNSTTVATLTINRLESGNVRVLESQLEITIRGDITSSDVVCVHDNGGEDTFTLRSLGTLGMVDILSDQIEDKTAGGCIVHYSWNSPSNVNLNNISHFMVTFNGSIERVDKNEEIALYMRAQPVCTCAAHNISIFAVDQCSREGPSRNIMAQSLSGATCNDGGVVNPPPTTDTGMDNETGWIIAVSILVVLLVLILFVSTVVILVLICGKKDNNPSVSYEMPNAIHPATAEIKE